MLIHKMLRICHEARNNDEKHIKAFGKHPNNTPNVTHELVSACVCFGSSQIKRSLPSPCHSISSARPCATRFYLQNNLQTSQSQTMPQGTNNETQLYISYASFISARARVPHCRNGMGEALWICRGTRCQHGVWNPIEPCLSLCIPAGKQSLFPCHTGT